MVTALSRWRDRQRRPARTPSLPEARPTIGRAGAVDQLTALRFVAALGVLLSHLVFLEDGSGSWRDLSYSMLLREGSAGVSFFYILSGFILSHAYRDRLLTRNVGLAEYAVLRVVRIMPLHWLVTLPLAAWLVFAKHQPISGETLALNLVLLHAWFPAGPIHYSFNGPSWSLSCELLFYAMFPLLIALRPRTLIILTAGCTMVLTVAAAWTVASGSLPLATAEWFFYVSPPARLLEFLVGMLLYLGWRRRMLERFAGTATEILLLASLPLLMIAFNRIGLPLPFRWQLAYILPMAALVLVFAYGRGGVSRALRARSAVLLGEASFALYLTHRPIVMLAIRAAEGRALGDGLAFAMAAGLVIICVAVSIAVFVYVDQPIQRTLRRVTIARLGRRREVTAAA